MLLDIYQLIEDVYEAHEMSYAIDGTYQAKPFVDDFLLMKSHTDRADISTSKTQLGIQGAVLKIFVGLGHSHKAQFPSCTLGGHNGEHPNAWFTW